MKKKNKLEKTMPLLAHLKELRIRLLRSFAVTFLVFLACYFFREDLLRILKNPVVQPLAKYSQVQEDADSQSKKNLLRDLNCHCSSTETPKNTEFKKKNSQQQTSQQQTSKQEKVQLNCDCFLAAEIEESEVPLVFIGLPEVFFSELKIAFFLALFFAFPYWIVEIWAFVLPGLYKKERKVFWAFVPATFLFFIGGASFGYFIVFPFGFEFFLSLTQPGEIVPFLSIGQYVSFAVKLLFAFGIVFEFPLIILFLSCFYLLCIHFLISI